MAGSSVAETGKLDEFRQWLDEPRNMQTFAISCAFAIIFPVYFAWAPALLGDSVIGPGSSGTTGDWTITFNETVVTIEEQVNLGDGDEHTSTRVVEDHPEGLTLARVEVAVTCNDNDDPGPGFTDSGSGESDVSAVSGEFEDQSESGDCSGGGGGGFTMTWDVVEGYDGAETNRTASEDEILAEWSDQGNGRGEWAMTLTAEISNPPTPAGDLVDDDEDYTIIWTETWFEMKMKPAAE